VRKKRSTEPRGFSLVELMVVISIIGLLSTIVTISVVKQRVRASQQKVRADVKQLEKVITLYHADVGRYPAALADLVRSTGEGWNGPYIEGGERALLDPWGRPYVYALTGDSDDRPYTIGSYGADGVAGGKDGDKDIFPMSEAG
jgi:general secretion pathway protein G